MENQRHTYSRTVLPAALVLVGFTAVVAQVVLMRELIVVFQGNEISLGLLLACWLLWTAAGSGVLGRWLRRSANPLRTVAGLETATAARGNLYVIALPRKINTQHI